MSIELTSKYSLENIGLKIEEAKLEVLTTLMPAFNAVFTTIDADELIKKNWVGITIGASIGAATAAGLTTLVVKNREKGETLESGGWNNAGAVGVLSGLGALVGGFLGYYAQNYPV